MTATVESAPFSAETSAEVVLRDCALYSSVLCSTAGLGIGILKNAGFKLLMTFMVSINSRIEILGMTVLNF